VRLRLSPPPPGAVVRDQSRGVYGYAG
jgi:hypothetical protein